MAERGRILSDEELAAALAGGFSVEITDYTLIPDTEYVLLASAMSEGGMESFSNAAATTPAHLDPDAEWQVIPNAYAGYIDFNIHTLGTGFYFNGDIVLEKIQGRQFYRAIIPFYSDDAFVSRMQEEGFTCTYEDCYIYFDATFEDGGMMLMPPFESYIGFTTSDGLPLYITSRYMPGYLEFGGEYLNIVGEFFMMAGNSAADMMEMEHEGHFDMNIHLPGGIPVSGGASNESYEIKDEVAWD